MNRRRQKRKTIRIAKKRIIKGETISYIEKITKLPVKEIEGLIEN